MLGISDGFTLRRFFLFENAQIGELVFHLVEGEEDDAFVIGGAGIKKVARLPGRGFALARVEEKLCCLCSERPERAGALNPRAAMRAFKATGAA